MGHEHSTPARGDARQTGPDGAPPYLGIAKGNSKRTLIATLGEAHGLRRDNDRVYAPENELIQTHLQEMFSCGLLMEVDLGYDILKGGGAHLLRAGHDEARRADEEDAKTGLPDAPIILLPRRLNQALRYSVCLGCRLR